ncbi:MAG: GSCFA domain-containing protein [Sphingobium sp.]|nr:GSCFA domain-containing protein [Sphingobium sp.]
MPVVSLSYEDAMLNAQQHGAHWPRDAEDQARRLQPFCMPELRPSFQIVRGDLIFTIGSCFARNVEQHLLLEGFNVAVSQFEGLTKAENVRVKSNTLNKFVAHSILNELQWALDPETPFPWDSIVQIKEDRYLDMQLAAGLLPASKETMFGMRRAVLNYMRMIKDARVIFITLGLAEAWFDREFGIYMNTLPLKAVIDRYPGRFEFHVLEYGEIVQALRQILSLLDTYGHPDFRLILSVSPVALSATFTERDALIANTYSKSVQRAAAEVISREHPRVDYYPSFESITLSERSVAWRDDCAHVADEAVRLNVLRMQNAYLVRDSEEPAATRTIDQGRALALVKEAAILAASNDFQAAENLFKQAALLVPDEPIVRFRWGRFLFKQARYAEASEQMKMALDLGAGSHEMAYNLAKCYWKLGKFRETALTAQIAIQIDPDEFRPYELAANAFRRLGENDDAEAMMSAAAKLKQTSVA